MTVFFMVQEEYNLNTYTIYRFIRCLQMKISFVASLNTTVIVSTLDWMSKKPRAQKYLFHFIHYLQNTQCNLKLDVRSTP